MGLGDACFIFSLLEALGSLGWSLVAWAALQERGEEKIGLGGST